MSLSALQPHSPLFTFLYSSSTWSTVIFVFLYLLLIADYDFLDIDLVLRFDCICVFVIGDDNKDLLFLDQANVLMYS